MNGEYVILELVQHEILESPVKVYNLNVEEDHTYYVSDNGVLVHNSCQQTGLYKIEFKTGKNYVGKGSEARMKASVRRIERKYNDIMVTRHWDPAPNAKKAFVDEYIKMSARGVNNSNTYNRIWSPGRKYI